VVAIGGMVWGRTSPPPDWFLKVMDRTHRTALRLSGNRIGSSIAGMPVVELHTTGRQSGTRRSTVLTTPVVEGDRLVLVASKGGAAVHPDWYRNLLANPDVEITRGSMTTAMRARTATPSEKAELWPRIVSAYGGYANYQQITDRDIPVVLCEPRDP
jgi:deazaflavin-dependent oxidoreductase (nitroreductase family)